MERGLVRKIQEQVRKNLTKTGFGTDQKLIVAVSGGPDSMTLFDSLQAISDQQRLTLHPAHLNHGIRPESASIAQQLNDYFAQTGLDSTISQVDTPAFQQQSKLSMESAARYLRYQFLTQVLIDKQADAIAIAHTADDQAETVLMHLIRGSGLNGLSGMRLANIGQIYPDLPTAQFVRPLLTVTKQQTNQYCQIRNLNPEHDYTNDQTIYQRNRIRHNLLPELATYNPQIKQTLNNLAEMSAQISDLLNNLVQTEWDQVIQETASGPVINRSQFQALDPALKNHLLRKYLESTRGNLTNITFKHLQQLLSLMQGPSRKHTVLPGGAIFTVDKNSGALEIK